MNPLENAPEKEAQGERLGRGLDFINHFEEKSCVSIPQYLKNLLEFSGFDNYISLKHFDEQNYREIENIAKNVIPSICKTEDRLEKYLGPFKTDPTCFFIVPGHKNLIKELKSFAETYVPKRATAYSPAGCSSKKKEKIVIR